MLKHLEERRQGDQGFTLIELMVVVLIMGILMAIAIPTFLSTQNSAHDASAKSNATNAFTNEKAYYVNNSVFLDSGHAAGQTTIDSQLPWDAASATGGAASAAVPTKSDTLSVQVGTESGGTFTQAPAPYTGNVLVVYDLSSSKNCFYIVDDESVSPPVLGYGESSGGCFAVTAIPTATAVSVGHAGTAIAAGAAPTAWFTKF